MNAPEDILIISKIFTLMSEISWEINKETNWISDVLKYEQQVDGHSCGYYVLLSMRISGKVSSKLPMVSYNTYNNNHTIELRDICNIILIGDIVDTFVENYGESSTVDVFRFLNARINGSWYEEE